MNGQQLRQLLVDRGQDEQEQDWESTRALGRPISFNSDDVNWSVVFRRNGGLPRTQLPAGVACHQSLEQEEMKGKEEFPLCDGCTSARTRSSSTVQPWDVVDCHRIIDQSFTTENAEHEWKVQYVTTQLEPNVTTNPRDGNVKWRQDQTCSWVCKEYTSKIQKILCNMATTKTTTTT